jgi:hypothetical protein
MTEQTTTAPLDDTRLDEIAARAAGLYEYATGLDDAWQAEADQLAGTDVPALIADLHRQRQELDSVRANRDYWRDRYRTESRTTWSSEVPPGGEVCADCGEPVESEPCREHNPTAVAEQLRAELAKYVGAEPTIAEEMAYLSRCFHAVHDVCDEAERQATRWE